MATMWFRILIIYYIEPLIFYFLFLKLSTLKFWDDGVFHTYNIKLIICEVKMSEINMCNVT